MKLESIIQIKLTIKSQIKWKVVWINVDVQNLFNIINTKDEIWNINTQDFEFENQVGLIPIISFQVDY